MLLLKSKILLIETLINIDVIERIGTDIIYLIRMLGRITIKIYLLKIKFVKFNRFA